MAIIIFVDHFESHFEYYAIKFLFKCSNNAGNDFIDFENLHIDTKIIILAPLDAEIFWLIQKLRYAKT